MRIPSNEVTIVMQGKVLFQKKIDKFIIKNIQKVKKIFPESTIIISTWKLEPILNVQFNKLANYLGVRFIFNDDPGVIKKTENGIKYISNINRMIVSSLSGIRLAKTKFVIKMRTDSYFTSNTILRLLWQHIVNDKFKREVNYLVFGHRVLNYNLFSRNARGYLPYLFHPGDILFCGYKKDVISIFNIDLADEKIFKTSKHRYFYTIMNYVPEQYIWVKCIEKQKKINVFGGNNKIEKKLLIESERYYMNNFIPFCSRELSFCWEKHKNQYHNKGKYSVYDYLDWIRLYNRYISRLYTPVTKKYIIKITITFFMIGYFYIRKNLLSIPLIRRVALNLFNKRG